jgi:hypothetical protein
MVILSDDVAAVWGASYRPKSSVRYYKIAN